MMKKYASFFFLIFLITAAMLLTSCGEKKGQFKMEGKFLNLNRGEFYVYSPEGIIDGMDTIKVEGGRFAYQTSCSKRGTLMLVFPNFSQQPIFVEPGKSVDISANASHLKEMEVDGTDDNELMTGFRKQISSASPPDVLKYAETFIKDHPESYVCTYLIRNYYLETDKPDYEKATNLIKIIEQKQEKCAYLSILKKLTTEATALNNGKGLPAFSDYDTNGKMVSSTTLNSAPFAVINVWSSWNYDSQDIQRALKKHLKKSVGKLKVVSINVDASKKDCENTMKRDSITWPNICDGNMFEGKTIRKLGITTAPYNIILKNGKVVAYGLRSKDFKDKLDELLK